MKNLKKYLIFVLILTFLACKNKNDKYINKDFVYIENNHFIDDEKEFFPIMLNYIVNIRKINDEYVITSLKEYEKPQKLEGNTKDSALTVLKGHLTLLKELGFNSIRLVGFDRISLNNNIPQINTFTPEFKKIKISENYDVIFECINQFVKIADELDLKIMFLLRGPIDNSELKDFTIALLEEFNDNPTIFAYDFFNEPLYFDNSDLDYGERHRTKKSAYKVVNKWRNLMDKYAPNQLMTIGFSEPLEVFEWDPSILPVDFVAFHTYHPLRVPNEIYWYSKYVNKPWMIGETSLPADNDSISYFEQKQFLTEVYKKIVNCGGMGIGWWGFQDVSWGSFEHDYTSIMNRKGQTKTNDGKYFINGTLKPVAYEFAKLKDYKSNDDCKKMPNYYNILGYHNYVINGKIIDKKNGKPIEGAVIRGWTKWWKIGANTFSNEKGEFTLYSNKEFTHFEISAPGMSREKFNKELEYELINKNLKISEDSLKNKNLEYHDISYQHFLKNKKILDTTFVPEKDKFYIFNFDEKKFNKAIFKAHLGNIELEYLNF